MIKWKDSTKYCKI